MEARDKADPLSARIDESTSEFEVVRQSRIELLTLRKQRRKVHALLTLD